MNTLLNLFTIINLTVLGGILFFGRKTNLANKILGLVIFIPATPFAFNYLIYIGLLKDYPALAFICFNMLWAPMVWWYVKVTLGRDAKLKMKHLWHLLPYLVYFTFHVTLLFRDKQYVSKFFDDVFNGTFPFAYTFINSLMLIQCFSYLIYSYITVRNEIRIYSSVTNTEFSYPTQFKWLKFFLELLIGLNIIAILLYAIFPLKDVVYIYAPLIYDVAFYVVIAGSVRNSTLVPVKELKDYMIQDNKNKTCANPFQKTDTEAILHQIKEYFEKEKPFLNPEFSLNELAVHTHLSIHLISYSINQATQKTFPDFMNQYRVEYAINKLRDPSLLGLSIDGIGLECGFGSKTSFFRSFKKITGFTPAQLLRLKEREELP